MTNPSYNLTSNKIKGILRKLPVCGLSSGEYFCYPEMKEKVQPCNDLNNRRLIGIQFYALLSIYSIKLYFNDDQTP